MEENLVQRSGQGQLASAALLSPAAKSPQLYGLGVLAINIMLESFSGYAYFFYVEVLGLAMSLAAVVRMIYSIWNSANDPIFAFFSDNTRSRWGRRHVWLVPAMLLTAAVYVLIFSVPESLHGANDLFRYMLLILLLFETLMTILIVNYVPLFPEYFRDLRQRSTAAAYYHAGKIIAVLIGLSLTPLVYGAIGFTGMAITYAALSVGLLAIALAGNREDPQLQAADRIKFLPALGNVLQDRSFWSFGITITLVLFGVNMVPFALPFYVKYALGGGPGMISVLSAAALLASLLTLPVWGRLVRMRNVKSTFVTAILVMFLGTLILALPPNPWTGIPAMMVIGAAWGGIWVCNNIIRADLVSQNLIRTEKHTEALYYALLNVIQNAGGILQSAAMLLASLLFGYVSGENPGPHPDMAFRFLIGFAPLLVLVISWFAARSFFRNYPEPLAA